MTTDRPFKTTAYKFYGQSQPLRPAPAPAHRGTAALLLAVLVCAVLVAAYYLI